MKTPFISVRSSGELWEIGACVQVLRQLRGSRRAGEGEVSPEVSLRHRLELAAGGACVVPALYGQAGLAGTVTWLSSRSPPAQPSPAVAFPS